MKMNNAGSFTSVQLDHRVRQLNNGTLVLSVTSVQDDGQYVCKAYFDANREARSRIIRLQIKGSNYFLKQNII